VGDALRYSLQWMFLGACRSRKYWNEEKIIFHIFPGLSTVVVVIVDTVGRKFSASGYLCVPANLFCPGENN
jgi:hypothetical protein